MPEVTVRTNVSKETIPNNFVGECAELVAKSLAIPVEHISVILHAGVNMFCSGSSEPAAVVRLQYALSKFDDIEENKKLTTAVNKHVMTKLNLEPRRITAELVSVDPTKVGLETGMLLSEVLKM